LQCCGSMCFRLWCVYWVPGSWPALSTHTTTWNTCCDNTGQLINMCGNKMPTKCNRWFLYCRCYCLLNMFQAPICPSSGAQEYYTGGCCLWHLVLWFSSCRSDVELRVVCPVCGMFGILLPHINSDARSNSHQIYNDVFLLITATKV